MNPIEIRHSGGVYTVAFESLEAAFARLPSDIRFVTDANVHRCYGQILDLKGPNIAVPAGEGSKSLETLGAVLSWLATTRASRRTTICAVGGGVIGDLAGFASAVYMRGVKFVQIPTTLLAQVDSSVGGKVGIDLPEGKNLAGAFYPPKHVSVPTDCLMTLPDREFRNGMAEVWKYGFIMDKELVKSLTEQPVSTDSPFLAEMIHRCIAHKAHVVQEDEFETTGLRAILNFGHTVGHAIEFLTGYGAMLHGEAIAIGMVVEARFGELLGVTQPGTSVEIAECLERQGLPTTHPILSRHDDLIHAMYGDKKAASGKLSFSLLTEIGRCRLVENVEVNVLRQTLMEL